MINLTTTTCYTVQNDEIVEGTLADFARYIESTPRPCGVGYKYYVTTVARDTDDVWVLAKWATPGGPEVIVREFKSEEAANAAAEETYMHDIFGNSEITVHPYRVTAERELAQIRVAEIQRSNRS